MIEANRRIVRNTGLLYFRLIFLTIINFYAVRVTLQALGVVDYGVYDVVASVVASLSIFTGAMTSASQRFLSFHLGSNDHKGYSHTFTLLLMTFMAMSVAVIIIGEILGYFFINDWLKIPEDRIHAASLVYQASLISLVVSLITIPYTSSIVANERMDAFAAFSVVEGVMRLGIALLLVEYGGDRLSLYGWLTASISVVVLLMSMRYCHVKFGYCKYIWKWDRALFSQLAGYTGWNLFGSISALLANQGQNVLLGIFFGPLINTAKGIADRIMHVISGFSVNLYMAVSPQIIKSYAGEDYQRTHSLVIKSSKIAFMLIFILSYPLMCNMDGLLQLWLGADSIAPYMVVFSKLILIYCMVMSLEAPVSRMVQASGNIKFYQMAVGCVTLCYIPIAALVLWLGASPVTTLVVQIAVVSIAQFVRVLVAHRQMNLDYRSYFKNVLCPIAKVVFVAVPVYWAMSRVGTDDSWYLVLMNTGWTIVAGLFMALFLGLDGNERSLIWHMLKSKISK